MIANLINTAYSHAQTANRWYWSRVTQQHIANTLSNTRDILNTLVILLSHLYSDCVSLVDTWLSYGLDAFVITDLGDNEVEWYQVMAALYGDFAELMTNLSFTLGDARQGLTEVYYRVRTVLS